MTKGLTAWKYFLKKFPTASSYTAEAIVNCVSSLNTLKGMYWAAAADKGHRTVEELDDSIERMAHPRWSVDYVLFEFFGVDRSKGTKDENFDSIEISDSLGYNKTVIQMFRKRDKELGLNHEENDQEG